MKTPPRTASEVVTAFIESRQKTHPKLTISNIARESLRHRSTIHRELASGKIDIRTYDAIARLARCDISDIFLGC